MALIDCPECGEGVPAKARTCPWCGKRLRAKATRAEREYRKFSKYGDYFVVLAVLSLILLELPGYINLLIYITVPVMSVILCILGYQCMVRKPE